jgi:hypothetical protein
MPRYYAMTEFQEKNLQIIPAMKIVEDSGM